MRDKKWLFVGIIVGLIVLIGATIGITMKLLTRSHTTIPDGIVKQLQAPALLPTKNSPILTKQKSYKYDSQNQVFSYVVTFPSTKQATVTEEPTPSNFVDIPGQYQKLVDSFHPFLTFDSPLGSVNVGNPPNLNGDQAAIANSQGDLIFIHPTSNLNESEWRQLFNNLVVTR